VSFSATENCVGWSPSTPPCPATSTGHPEVAPCSRSDPARAQVEFLRTLNRCPEPSEPSNLSNLRTFEPFEPLNLELPFHSVLCHHAVRDRPGGAGRRQGRPLVNLTCATSVGFTQCVFVRSRRVAGGDVLSDGLQQLDQLRARGRRSPYPRGPRTEIAVVVDAQDERAGDTSSSGAPGPARDDEPCSTGAYLAPVMRLPEW
jgi:hypothetical protein